MHLKQTEAGQILIVEISSGNCQENIIRTCHGINSIESLPTILKVNGAMLAAQAMALCDAVRNRVLVVAVFDRSEQAYIVAYSTIPYEYPIGTYID